MQNFKDSLNILKTSFEMKANLPQKEVEIQNFWLEKNIYQKILEKNRKNKEKVLHDGPPYANGSLHCGHALNKTLKDIVTRRWNHEGYYSFYIPGWDTHGMPIEHALIKLGKNVDPNLSIAQKRSNCYDFAVEQIEVQKKQFRRLGLETDFKTIYRTLDKDFEAEQLKIFGIALKKNLVYQSLKPVYWSWSSQTALAEAEVEYADVRSPSIYVAFTITKPKSKDVEIGDQLLIWTTTPWTIPANLAIAVKPSIRYARIKVGNKHYIVGENCINRLATLLEWKNHQVLSYFPGKVLEHTKYVHPLYDDRSGIVILADYVSDTNGTGLVHNAPGFGDEDYFACKVYDLHPYVPIDQYGKFTDDVKDPELVGLFYDDANKIITQRLNEKQALLKLEFINHSVAHDWRTKKPVIYRAAKQWFINIEKIRKQILGAIKDVKFPSPINEQQLTNMINERSEWCISRQRYWGVPIPIIFNSNDEPIFDQELLANIIKIIGEEGSNVWFNKPVEYFLTKKYLNGNKYRKETDIMDVWFDSGTSFSILGKHGLEYPAEIYLEGKDQFRGWFNSSLINGVIAHSEAPYRQLLGCGFVLDEEGRKMSKSLGNIIDPLDVCNRYGADILRLWVAVSDYGSDLRIGNKILEQVSETYRRIRNTLFKFILANISDFDYQKNRNIDFNEIDYVVLNKLSNNIKRINECYDRFVYNEIIDLINNHTIELSGWYFDIIKDALYCDEKNHPRRRAIQTVLYEILELYLYALAPIIPHTCEEVYQNFNKDQKLESLFLEEARLKTEFKIKPIKEEKWEQFKLIKDAVFKELEKLRNDKKINKNTQAKVIITFDNKYDFTEQELKQYLNVAQVIIEQIKQATINVQANNAGYVRCERCWNYFPEHDLNKEQICERCANVIKQLK